MQDAAYREQVLPPAVTARVSIEAGVTSGWERWRRRARPRDRHRPLRRLGARQGGGAQPRHLARGRGRRREGGARCLTASTQPDRAATPSAKLFAGDGCLWSDDPRARAEIGRWTAGSRCVGEMRARGRRELEAWAAETMRGFDRVVLCGMGGSSLAPLVCSARRSAGRLHVLDTTDPDAVLRGAGRRLAVRDRLEVGLDARAGGDGGALLAATGGDGSRFVADHRSRARSWRARAAGARLPAHVPEPRRHRRPVLGAVLLRPRAGRARRRPRSRRCSTAPRHVLRARPGPASARPTNAPLQLGALLGDSVAAGPRQADDHRRPGASGSFGLWLEQLIAESTGKEGTGVVPLADEPIGPPERLRRRPAVRATCAATARTTTRSTRSRRAGFHVGALRRSPTCDDIGGADDHVGARDRLLRRAARHRPLRPAERRRRRRTTACAALAGYVETGDARRRSTAGDLAEAHARRRDAAARSSRSRPTSRRPPSTRRALQGRAPPAARPRSASRRSSASARATCTRPASCTRAARGRGSTCRCWRARAPTPRSRAGRTASGP